MTDTELGMNCWIKPYLMSSLMDFASSFLFFSSVTVIEICPQLLGESWDTEVTDRCF